MSLAGQLRDPSDVQPKKPSITDKSLLVFSFSLQIASQKSFRMFKDTLIVGKILLTCCKLAFLGNYKDKQSRRNEKNNPVQEPAITSHYTTSSDLYYCSWNNLFWWSLTIKKENINTDNG